MIGKTLGHYEITDKLGQGGMGSVWLAQDAKLGRQVAIKTLPEEFAKDEERLARFEREAKLLASLNHPNIAAIYGLEEDSDTRFLVLELVEGDTLADRLKRGAIAVEESLKLALQIAEALEEAHENGVIHRDLKPANIKVTPDGKVKVLDFGLAKAFVGDGADASLSNSPTLSMAATQQGVILGTAAYMSPEQARGQEVDKRADVWAFGVVLFEMLTGRGTFDGGTVSDVLAGVLAKEPQWNTLPLNLHPRTRLLLERCLEKEAKDRYGDISDARVDIQKVLSDPDGVIVQPEFAQAPPRPILRWIAVTAVISVIFAGVAVWMLKLDTPTPHPVVRFPEDIPEGGGLPVGRPALAISPDDKYLAYAANDQLYLREVAQMDAVPIRGTDGAVNPFFSPDGQWIGFAAGGQLKKVPIGGGPPITLCEAATLRGANWLPDGTIVFTPGAENVMRVSADGGEPETLVSVDSAAGELNIVLPDVLPDGDTLLFAVTTGAGLDEMHIVMQSISTGERQLLLSGGSPVRYLTTGHLVYYSGGVLLAAPFDPARGKLTGGSVALVEGIAAIGSRTGNAGVSESGSLAYVSGGQTGMVERSLVWVDQDGSNVTPLAADLAGYENPRISPDGTKVTFAILAVGRHIWVYDVEGGSLSQFTFEEDQNRSPAWTPDGSRITFGSNREAPDDIYWKLADGSGQAEVLLQDFEGDISPGSWSRDNTLAFYFINPDRTNRDIWTLHSENGTVEATPFLESPAQERGPRFSPDGKWIAYVSDESGRDEVWVRPYPSTGGGQRRISTRGGVEPVWSPDGDEVFFRTSSGDMMAVRVETDAGFRFEPPRMLFEGQAYMRGERGIPAYDIHPDGDRFLMIAEAGTTAGTTQRIHVVLNWVEELKERVPVQ